MKPADEEAMTEPTKKRARTENATREAIKKTERYNQKVDAFSEKVRNETC